MSTISQTIMSAKSTTGQSVTPLVQDFKTVVFTVSGANSPTATIKFFTSDNELPPDATAAQTASNAWDYAQVVDLMNGSAITGDTGIAFTGSADTRRFELNLNGARWCGAVITAISGGDVTVLMRAFANASTD